VIRIRRVVGPEPASLAELTALLQDVVQDGASVGFLVLLSEDAAANYWRVVLGRLEGGLVRVSHRGRSISSQLMQAVEAHARASGHSLLVLDTLSYSSAAAVYRHLGWRYAGSIPGYAATPDGELHATSYFYKQLT
jgi:GNAT superfamily N-acetyltransferase